MLQARDDGTSIVYGLVSWDPENPVDYLMAEWWAELPGQQPPELDFEEATRFSIVDGPELNPENPPDLPVSGQATYLGQSGRIYSYTAAGEAMAVDDEYAGTVNLTVDFGAGTVSGCVGASATWSTAACIWDSISGTRWSIPSHSSRTTRFTSARSP